MKLFLFLLLCGQALAAPVFNALQISSSTPEVAWWKLNNGSGTTATATVGSNGTLTSGPTWSIGENGSSFSVSFDGVDDYVSVGDISNLNPASASFSVSLWLKVTSSTAYTAIAKGNGTSGTLGWCIFTQSDTVFVRCNASGDATQRASQSASITSSTWCHVALVIDRSLNTITGYLNGYNSGWSNGGGGPSSNSISGFSSITTTAAFEMGRSSIPGSFLSGSIDDVRVYSRAISASEVLQIYNDPR